MSAEPAAAAAEAVSPGAAAAAATAPSPAASLSPSPPVVTSKHLPAPEAVALAADPRTPSVLYTPLAHIPARFVPESWTVEYDPAPAASAAAASAAAASALAASLPVPSVAATTRKRKSSNKPHASVCRFYFAQGQCRKGEACPFVHQLQGEAQQNATAGNEGEQKEQPDGAAAASTASTAAAAPTPSAASAESPPLPQFPAHPTSFLIQRVSSTPLMLRVPQFLSSAECAEVLRLAYAPGAPQWKPYRNVTYEPTVDPATGEVVSQKFKVGYSDAATLNQLDYGHYPEIYPLITRFAERVARLVNSDKAFSSNMRRLLRYRPGQKFELHADDYDRIEPLHRGRRMLTCLIYVHTEKEETGGGTVFPLLDGGSYRSPPVSGSMLIFRNFDPENGYKFDSRCQHYAETTTAGSKYAINLYFVEQDGMWWH